jgi:ATP-dependent RNA helicase DbpA
VRGILSLIPLRRFAAGPAGTAATLSIEEAERVCHARNDTRDVAAHLGTEGYSALALHGELEQRDRDEVLLRFANKRTQVLVATDVAARGLDIKGLPLVIAFELPIDPDMHVHRIGRTGRAGQNPLALSLVAPEEKDRARAIAGRQDPIRWEGLPAGGVARRPDPAPMVTLLIDGGRQDKLRPSDLLGALTGDAGIPDDAVGRSTSSRHAVTSPCAADMPSRC